MPFIIEGEKIVSRNLMRAAAAIAFIVVIACSAPGAAVTVTATQTVTPTLLPGQSLPDVLTEAAVRQTAVVPITPTPTTLPPTPTNRPVSSTTGGGGVQPTAIPPTQPPPADTGPASITSFTASKSAVTPGETITLNWATTANQVSIRVIRSTGQYGPWFAQPGTGSMDYTSDTGERNTFQIQLVAGLGDTAPYQNLTFKINCPDQWFAGGAPNTCPYPALSGNWVAQKFQHGLMAWIGGDGSIIMVRDDNVWAKYSDSWQEGDPELDPGIAPPGGLFQPVRGFGKVWRDNNLVDSLGWGLAAEYATPITYQCDSVFKSAVCLLRGPDGILILNIWGGGWKKLDG